MNTTATPTMQIDTAAAGGTKPGRAGSARATGASRTSKWRKITLGVVGILLVGVAWEVYKFLGPEKGFKIGEITLLPRTNDMSMPHIDRKSVV